MIIKINLWTCGVWFERWIIFSQDNWCPIFHWCKLWCQYICDRKYLLHCLLWYTSLILMYWSFTLLANLHHLPSSLLACMSILLLHWSFLWYTATSHVIASVPGLLVSGVSMSHDDNNVPNFLACHSIINQCALSWPRFPPLIRSYCVGSVAGRGNY